MEVNGQRQSPVSLTPVPTGWAPEQVYTFLGEDNYFLPVLDSNTAPSFPWLGRGGIRKSILVLFVCMKNVWKGACVIGRLAISVSIE
jgi:hypothetical protein